MSKQTLRYGILVLGIITGVIHAIILNLVNIDWLMLLNGLGFFVFTGIVFLNPAFLAGQRRFIHYLFIAYTLVTIMGFFVLNDEYGPLGLITKAVEVLLILALTYNLSK